MAAPVIDLPAPDSPTTPRISPGAIAKRHVVDRDQAAAAAGKLDPQVLDFEQRRGHAARLASGGVQPPTGSS